MSIQRFNQFPEGSGSLSNDDIFLFMDDPNGSGVTKKISLSQISSAIGGGGGNPFDQDLNTNNDVSFSSVSSYNLYCAGSGTLCNDQGGSYVISFDSYGDEGMSGPKLTITNLEHTTHIVSRGISFPDSSFQNTAGVTSINPSGLSSFVKINNIVSCSQADYDSLGSPDTNTFYIIIE